MTSFELTLLFCIIITVVWFLISIIALYIKYSGCPYKSEFHGKKLKHIGIIFLIWTVSFILKIIIAGIATKAFDPTEDTTFIEAIMVALMYIITEVIPYIATLDMKFIEILQMEYLKIELPDTPLFDRDM